MTLPCDGCCLASTFISPVRPAAVASPVIELVAAGFVAATLAGPKLAAVVLVAVVPAAQMLAVEGIAVE